MKSLEHGMRVKVSLTKRGWRGKGYKGKLERRREALKLGVD